MISIYEKIFPTLRNWSWEEVKGERMRERERIIILYDII